jgi:hypothetical protein
MNPIERYPIVINQQRYCIEGSEETIIGPANIEYVYRVQLYIYIYIYIHIHISLKRQVSPIITQLWQLCTQHFTVETKEVFSLHERVVDDR